MVKKSAKSLREKRALICDGGGMQGSFMAGVLKGFVENDIKDGYFDLCVGTSAGAFCLAYFLTGQIKEGLRIWEKHLPKGFIVWKNFHPYYDLDYLRKVITKIEPLNLKKLKNAKSQLVVSLTKPGASKAYFIDLTKSDNVIDTLIASVSAPILTKDVCLNGEVYYDGGFTAQPPINHPELKNYLTKVVLLTYPKGYRLKNWAWELGSKVLLKEPKLKKMVAMTPRLCNGILNKIEKDKNLLVIQPEFVLPGDWLEKDASKLSKNVKIGIETAKDFMKNGKLKLI